MVRSAVCWVIILERAISWSTSLRRALAAHGLRSGEYSEGACGSPASSAASRSVSWPRRLLK